MTVTYDPKTDTLRLVLRDVPVAESDEQQPGMILDLDAAGEVVSIEILDASKRVENPRQLEFRAAV